MERVRVDKVQLNARINLRGKKPVGTRNSRSIFMDNVKKHAAAGDLPHEILLKLARGLPIPDGYNPDGTPKTDEDGNIVYWHPSREERIDAAKCAAPYFAPKLSAVEVVKGYSDDALLQLISGAAAAAGFVLGPNGITEAAEYKEDAGRGSCLEVSPGVFDGAQIIPG